MSKGKLFNLENIISKFFVAIWKLEVCVEWIATSRLLL